MKNIKFIAVIKVSGKTYAEFLRENIFAPLEMKNSGYDDSRKIIPKSLAAMIAPFKANYGYGMFYDKYFYEFIVDGEWMIYPENKQIEDDGNGNTNSVKIVS